MTCRNERRRRQYDWAQLFRAGLLPSVASAELLIKRALRPVLASVALLFIAHTAYSLYSKWDGQSVEVNLALLVGALVVAGLAMVIQLVAWRSLILNMTGRRMPPRASARLYLDSQMARYTPGKVGLPVVRIAGAEAVGISPKVMGSALFIEVVSWSAVGSALGGVVLGLLPAARNVSKLLTASSLFMGAAAVGFLLVALVVDRSRLPAKVRVLAGPTGSGPLVPWTLPALHLLHFVTWILCGALICLSVGGSWEAAWVAGALLCVAIVAGFVALLAPAGAGVREAVMAIGLASLVGASASVSIGILARVASLLSDVILWGWFRYRAAQDSERWPGP